MRLAVLRIVAVYATFGALWILFSDRVLGLLVPDPAARDELQTVKGACYVAFTALLLWVLIRRHQRSLAARDRRLRAIVDSIPDAVLVVDRAGGVLDANVAAGALLGVRPAPDRRVPLPDFARIVQLRRADGAPLAAEDMAAARALRGELVVGFEARLRAADGRDVFVSVSAAPVGDGRGGAPELAVVAVRDVSEVKRFEELREEFLSTAAHELKTPLAVVKAYAQLMQKRGRADPTALATISRQIDRLTRLVQQLLEVSRFRLGGAELRPERFDLGEVVAEVATRLDAHAGGRLRIERDGPAAVDADRERIAQVVANLVENALRFSPGGEPVETSVVRSDGQAVFRVRDRGVGIPVERQARVFERFYRAHAGTGADYGGLGLGLDVSREIIARHGGRIWFESEPGVGSVFSFSLPLAPEGAT